jgi:hypothetical protein
LVDVPFVLSLFLLIFELAVVHDAADRRLLVRRHLDQVEARVARLLQGVVGAYHSQQFSIGRHHSDRGDADLFVDPLLLSFDRWFLQKDYRSGGSRRRKPQRRRSRRRHTRLLFVFERKTSR